MFPFKTDRGVQAFPLMLKLTKRNRELTGKSSGAQGGSAHGPVRRPGPVSAGGPAPSRGGQHRQSARLRRPGPRPHAWVQQVQRQRPQGGQRAGLSPPPLPPPPGPLRTEDAQERLPPPVPPRPAAPLTCSAVPRGELSSAPPGAPRARHRGRAGGARYGSGGASEERPVPASPPQRFKVPPRSPAAAFNPPLARLRPRRAPRAAWGGRGAPGAGPGAHPTAGTCGCGPCWGGGKRRGRALLPPPTLQVAGGEREGKGGYVVFFQRKLISI